MKKWMKVMSAVLMMCMVFCLLGTVGAKADEDDDLIREILSVKYEGDPVPYEEDIDKNDFEVRVRMGDGSRRELSSSEFDISPDTMEKRTSVRVTITIDGSLTVRERDLTARITVDCEKPKLESIRAEYDGDDLIVGGEIDRNDVTVTAYYTDGSSEEVTDWKFEKYKLTDGSNYVTIYYEEGDEEEEDEIRVDAFEGELEYISAYYNGTYVTVGNKVNTANIKVTGVFDADRYGRVTSVLTGWSLQNYTIREGNNTLTVVYRQGGKTYEDTINVVGRAQTTTTTTTPSVTNKNGRWEQAGNVWRWRLTNNSYLKNDWIQADGKWYFLDANANMIASAWKMVNSKWYYFNADGSMATGWKVVDGKWYFLDQTNGDMVTGWKLWNGKYYYLVPGSGEMATNRWIGNWYVDGQGVWTQTR